MTPRNLTAMVASRICHDLVSPIGAIGNGLELLALSAGNTPEMDLIQSSVASAQARIRLFRLAFGVPNAQVLATKEVTAILRDLGKGSRMSFVWALSEDRPRSEVQAALLAMLCVEGALPQGGRITVRLEDETWTVEGSGPAVRADPLAYGVLTGETDGSAITPAGVQFLLIAAAVENLGRRISVAETGGTVIALSF